MPETMERPVYPIGTCATCGNLVHSGPDGPSGDSEYGKWGGERMGERPTCVACGGISPEANGQDEGDNHIEMTAEEAADEKKFRKKMGDNYCIFMEARFPIVLSRLTTPSVIANFKAKSFSGKCAAVDRLIKRGLMI